MKNTTAISYLRFSSKRQGKLGKDSYRRQIEATEAYCKANGLQLNRRLEDLGVSAYSGKNLDDESALGGFLGLVKTGKIPKGTTLICENLDRLSRGKILDALTLFTGILRAGVDIVTTMDGKRYSQQSVSDNPTDLMISIIFLMRGRNESEIKAERVKKAWENKLAQMQNGHSFKHAAPLWLTFKGGHYVVNEERAKIIRKIFSLYIQGHGTTMIAQRLEAMNIPNFGRSKVWLPQTVAKILNSKSAMGVNDFIEPEVANYYPAVINEKTFYKVQGRLKAQRQFRGRKPVQETNIYSGLCKCATCGASMIKYYISNKKGKYIYLRCLNAKLKKTKCKLVRFQQFNDSFLAVLHSGLLTKFLTKNEAGKVEDRSKELTGRLIETDKKIERVSLAIVETDSKALVQRLKSLESLKLELEAQLEQNKVALHRENFTTEDYQNLITVEEFNQKLATEDYKVKLRTFMRSIIREVIVDSEGYRVEFKGPDYIVIKFGKSDFELSQMGEETDYVDYDAYK